MLDMIYDLKNNKQRADVDSSQTDRLKKWLRMIASKNSSSEALRITWDDLISADTKGINELLDKKTCNIKYMP